MAGQAPFPCRLSDWIPFSPGPRTYGLRPAKPSAGWSITSASPYRLAFSCWFRNVDLISIGYAFRPHLRARLTLSGLTFLRKPWVFGGRVSRPSSRYSFRHNRFCVVHSTLSVKLRSTAERSPTRRLSTNPKLRWWTLVPDIIGAGSLDQ